MKSNFFLFATNETAGWTGLPANCTEAFGVYLVREGEATHVCSMTPSSRADFMENVFVGLDYDVAADRAWIDEYGNADGGEATTYFGYIDRDLNLPRCSELREIEVDDAEFEHLPEAERADAARAALWEAARESFQSNAAGIPCLEA